MLHAQGPVGGKLTNEYQDTVALTERLKEVNRPSAANVGNFEATRFVATHS